MPYLIQVSKNYVSKVDALVAESEKAKEAKKKVQENEAAVGGLDMGMGMPGAPLMLTMVCRKSESERERQGERESKGQREIRRETNRKICSDVVAITPKSQTSTDQSS
jgi:hypothetical protein